MRRGMSRRLVPIPINGGAAAPAKIYGVSWDKAAPPALTRTDDAVGMVANAGLDGGVVVNDFDTAEIFGEITEVTDALGNDFVRIPKFYIRKTDGVGSKTWQVSKTKWAADWYLPWCFWDFASSAELAYVDVGKYPASLDGSSRLESKSGLYPLVLQNIASFRTYAQNNGAGYQQLDLHVADVLQTLFYVEFATLHSQGVMAGFTAGQYSATHTATVTENAVTRIIVTNAVAAAYAVGQAIGIGTSLGGNQIFYGRSIISIDPYDAVNTAISFDGAAVNIAIGNILYNVGWRNGWSSSVAASSGAIDHLTSGKFPMMYRGIENVWGNVWQFVDGVNINERQGWVCLDADDYASNLFAAPYLQLGYINHNADGYTSAMGWDANYPFAALPVAIAGGGATSFYSDYYFQSTGQRVALLGGVWNYGTAAGLSFWRLIDASSHTYVNVGGRLLRKAL